MRFISSFILSIILVIVGNGQACAKSNQLFAPKILILNSYHEGHQWSDKEVIGIESALYGQFPHANVQIEYMDTKRNFTPTRFEELRTLYGGKFAGKRFDLIISTDDNAFQFLRLYREEIFGDTPIIFCGLNHFQPKILSGMKNLTGIAEHIDYAGTLEAITRLHPSLKKLTILSDLTPTGQLMQQQIEEALARFPHTFSTEILQGLPISELEEHLSRLAPGNAVLLGHYLRDREGSYYKPVEVIKRLSHASKVPIYAADEIQMNHGLAGGALNEGYIQGSMAGELATRVLAGENPNSIPVQTNPSGRLVFDHRQMVRFGLNVSNLPNEAVLANVKKGNQKDILILHSYHPRFLWTSRVFQGLTEGLAENKDIGEIFEEYMDTKRYSDPAYFHQLYQLYLKKYAHRSLDAVIVSDDHAFNFARKYRKQLLNDASIIFCGVNYMKDTQSINKEGITGILQLYDIKGTLNALFKAYPKTENILVINDSSTTGRQYKRRLSQLIPKLKKKVSFEYTYDLTMEQILDKVSSLDAKTGVLFLIMTRDANNQRYQFKESVRMISQASIHPIFSPHEDALENGAVGGSITYGRDHGLVASRLANRILSGENARSIPIIEASSHRLMFSYPALKRYKVPMDLLPPNSTLIDEPTDIFYQHKWKIIIIGSALVILVILVGVQQRRFKREAKDKRRLEIEAHIDEMTGAINRNYFESEVISLLDKCRSENKKMTLCYADINQLKYVNDFFGHSEGDSYIIAMVSLLRSAIRSSDRIYRMGGDEFIMVFEDCNREQAGERISAVRDELTRLNKQYDEDYSRGISFGMATFDPKAPEELNQLLEDADQQMYLDKKARIDESVSI